MMMSRTETKSGIIVLILTGFLLALAIGLGSSADGWNDEWYLSSKPNAGPVMYRGMPTSDPGGCSAVTVPQPPNSVFWISNESAPLDGVGWEFDAAIWTVYMVANNKNSGICLVPPSYKLSGAFRYP